MKKRIAAVVTAFTMIGVVVGTEGALADPTHSVLIKDADDEQRSQLEEALEKRALEMVNELSNRRRLHYLFPNPQLPNKGVQKFYVNVGDGNLTFIQRDIVRIDGIPILAGRVYDSSIEQDPDFGPGWKFSMAEEIVHGEGNTFIYIDANNNRHALRLRGRGLVPEGPNPLSIKRGTRSRGSIVLRDSNHVRTFRRAKNRIMLSRIVDRNGNWIAFEYQDGLISSLSTSNDRFIKISRNDLNRIESITDDAGQTVLYQYTPTGSLQSSTLLSGEEIAYHYDDQKRLVEMVDPRGVPVLVAAHDDAGRVNQISVLANSLRFDYDRRKTTVTDKRGYVSTFAQDTDGNTVSVTDNQGVVTRISIDNPYSMPTNFSVNDVSLAQLSYTKAGELERASYSAGDATIASELSYFPTGLLKSLVVNGVETASFNYDEFGRLTVSKRLNQEIQTIAWNDNGQPTLIQMGDMSIAVSSDRFGRVTGFSDANGDAISVEYDNRDRVAAINSNQIGSSIYNYGAGKFRSSTEYGNGNAVHFEYDAAGNIRQFRFDDTDAGERIDRYVVGAHNELQEIVRSDGPDFIFEYDEVGRATKVKSGDREFSIEYDEQSRVTKTYLDGRSAVEVDYSLTQLDIAHYTDSSTFRTRYRQSPGSGVFGTIAEIVYTRPLYSPYQAVAFDSEMNRFILQLPEDWHPEKILFDSFTRRHLPLSKQGLTGTIAHLDKPSSALFVPPELFSVNCGVCTVSLHGHILTINGSSSAIVDPGEWVVAVSTASASGCDNDNPGPPPPVLHAISFDTGLVASAAIPGSFTFAPGGPFYESPGSYEATASMVCSCGVFGISFAGASVEVRPWPGVVLLALTFDDGPHLHSTPTSNHTIAILGTLAAKSLQYAKPILATFFVERQRMSTLGQSIIESMNDAGHEVAIHGVDPVHHKKHQDTTNLGAKLEWMKTTIDGAIGRTPKHIRPPGGWAGWTPGINTQAQVAAAYDNANLVRYVSSQATSGTNSWFGDAWSPTGACTGCASHSVFVGYAKTAIDQAILLNVPARVLLMHDIREDDRDALGTIIDEIEAYASSKNKFVAYVRVKDLEDLGY